jgi:hypothetical protein
LHCLIVRGDDRTVVRSLSGVTRINGHDISEATLARGDRLTIGTIEFEVVDGIAEGSRSKGSIAEQRPAASIVREPTASHDGDHLIAVLKDTARHGRGRARRLLNQLREVKREQELANLRLARLEESNERLGRELTDSVSERQRLQDEQSRLVFSAGSDDENRRQLDEQRTAVEQALEGVEQERGNLSQERSALEQARAAIQEDRLAVEQDRSAFEQERSNLSQERAALEQVKAAIQEERNAFEQHRNAGEQERSNLDQERSALEQARAAIQEERDALQQIRSAIEQDRGNFHQERASFEQERSALAQAQQQQIEQERFALEQVKQQIELDRSGIAESRRQFEQQRDAAAGERAVIEQERARLRQEQSAVESQHRLLQQELRAFEEHKHALTAERLDWQSEASKAEAELAGRRQELDCRAAAIEKQQSDQEAARRRVEESQKALAKRQETLQQAENDLLERKRQAQEQEQALIAVRKALEKNQVKLNADRKALEDEQAQLADEKQSVAELREQGQFNEDEWSRRLAEQARQLTEATERLKVATKDLANQQALVEDMRQEFDDERQQWETERAKLRFEPENNLASYRSGASQVEVRSGQSCDLDPAAPQDSLSFETDSESEVVTAAPDEPERNSTKTEPSAVVSAEPDEPIGSDANDVGAQRVDGVAPQAQSNEEVAAGYRNQPQEELAFAPDEPAIEPRAEARLAKTHEAEEESIDDYMTRLLKRVQNIGQRQRPAAANASPPTAAQASASPKDAGDGATAPPSEGSAVQEVLAKLSRRAAAPELSSDIAAMRELANLSARAAIDKYAYRNWGRAAIGKFTIALLAAAAGVGAVHFAAAPDSMLMYAGLLSFVISLFWLLQAGILVKNVFEASRRNARMAEALCHAPGAEAEPQTHDHAREADDLPPAEIIAVQDG